MGTSYNASTVTNGLVLAWDVANKRSYSGSGNTLSNLVNAQTFSIAGTATFSSVSGGNLSFDGSTNYVDFTANNLGTTTTVEMWLSLGAEYTGKMFFGWFSYDVWCHGGAIGYNTANSDVYGINSTTVTNLGLVGNYKHYVFEMRSDVSYTNNKIYINGVSQSLSQLYGTELAVSRNFNSGVGRLSSWANTLQHLIPMNWATFKIYNRALTQAEINQNFAANRGRYGV